MKPKINPHTGRMIMKKINSNIGKIIALFILFNACKNQN